MRLNLTFTTDAEWTAIRMCVENIIAKDPKYTTNTAIRTTMTKGLGEGAPKFTVQVAIKETVSGYSLVAREEKEDGDIDSGPGS